MKSIEEIKNAVLAYCEDVCPNENDHFTVIQDYVSIKHSDSGLPRVRFILWLFDVSMSINAQFEDGNDELAVALYRLLGLESRDAVAAEKSRSFKEIDSCTLSLGKMAIRAKVAEKRNAALVAFVQKCATDPHEMIFLSNDYGSGGELFPIVDYEILQKEAKSLITTNKTE